MKLIVYILIPCVYLFSNKQNNTKSIKQKTDSLYVYALAHNNNSLLNQALKSYIKYYYRKNDSLRFHKFTQEHIKLTTKIQDTTSLARTLEYIAAYHRRNNHVNNAYTHYLKSLKLYTATKDSLNMGFTLLNLAIIQKNLRDYPSSMYKLKKVLVYIKNKAKPRRIASVYNTLANNYQHLEEYDSAVSYHHKALEIRKNIKNPIYSIKSLNNIGLTYKKQHKYTEALNYFNKALSSPNIITDDPSLYAKLLDNKTHTLLVLQNTDNKTLENNFIKALSIRDSINDIYGKVMSYIHLAEFYQYSKNKEKTKYYLKKAQRNAKQIDNHQDYIEALELQILFFEGKEKKEAFQKYTRIRNQLDFTDKKKLSRLYEMEDKLNEKEIVISENEAEKQQQYVYILLLLLVVLSIISAYILSIRKKRKKELLLAKEIEILKDTQNEVFCSSDFSLNEENKNSFRIYLKKKLKITKSQIEFWEYQSQGLSEQEIVTKVLKNSNKEVTIGAIEKRRQSLYRKLKNYYNLETFNKVDSIEHYRKELKTFSQEHLQKSK